VIIFAYFITNIIVIIVSLSPNERTND